MGNGARLAVVIVSFNTRELLRRCLASLERARAAAGERLQLDVVVVDNASRDDSSAMVAADFPRARLVCLAENRGFTGGNNAALRALGLLDGDASANTAPDYVLLLNPDTEVVGDALERMVEVLNGEEQVGAVGASLRYGDGRFQHGAFRFPGPAQVALDIAPIARLAAGARLYASGLNGRYPEQAWQGMRPFDVDFVLGAALMAKAETLRQVGGLDEGFFMYCEEMDWCMRARAAGWRIMAEPRAHIVHHEGQSSLQVRWPMYERLWKSRLRFYDKHREVYGPLTRLVIRGMILAGMAWGSRVALQRFARGEMSGLEAGEEVQARRAVRAEL